MSGARNNGNSNSQQVYTSFDQFIAQNDFSHLTSSGSHQNQYSSSSGQQYYYQPGLSTDQSSTYTNGYSNGSQYYTTPSQFQGNSYTLTADATEFVPRVSPNTTTTGDFNHVVNGQTSYYGNYNQSVPVVQDVAVPISSLSLSEKQQTEVPTVADQRESSSTPVSATAGGAVPKQAVNGRNNRGSNNNPQPTTSNNRRQQQQFKNPRPDRRKHEPSGDDDYSASHWDGGGGSWENSSGYDQNGYHNPRQSNNHNGYRGTNENRSNNNQHQNRSQRNNESYRNNGNASGGRGDKKSQYQPVEPPPKRKPTDYQPNRNLKRPDRNLDLPSDISQREKQIVEIDAGFLECLVCCETIKPAQSTWNCKNCYHILHLACTIKWATRSKLDDGWRCPACQNLTLDVPYDYYCFCSKQKNPQYNRNDVAHSCGEVCGRQTGCTHPCTLLCHPGACPTCQASVTRNCGCGATTKTMICSQEENITCDGICEKSRNCGLHKCEKKCHTGECADCEETLQHECYCGQETKVVACTAENLEEMKFSCESACEWELSCKNHKCQQKCHAGDCHECDLTPDRIKACPCGKKPILPTERTTCLDEIPLCDSVCNKILACGAPSSPHRCVSKCHLGACPPCLKSTAVKCRCGQMDQMVKCKQLTTRADDARCKKKCPKKRSCGKHKCNLECCIDFDHICPLPCPATLTCGKHKCERTCHPGHCLPCQRASFHELQCECGAQILYPPVPCGTKKPVCDKPCIRRHACTHAVLHNCHTGAVCPPCMIQTTKACYGQHEQRRTIPCSQESFSCGMPCNKELPCKEHKCIKTCHEGECMAAGEVCKQSCSKLRPVCGHKCMAPCHVGDCPETMCKEVVEVVCQCANRKQNRLCHDFANEFKRIATAQLASSLQDMQSGSSSGLKDLFGPIKWTTAKKLDCDDNCAILERNRRMAIGLQIRNPDLGSKLSTKYSDYLKNWAKEDPRFIEMIHDKLTELVKLAKESKQRSRSHSFPVMNREKRHAVHDMCEVFGVESKAYDAEPQRNIVATAYKDRSWLPAQSIMEVMKKESGGLRRVPGPAWGVKRA